MAKTRKPSGPPLEGARIARIHNALISAQKAKVSVLTLDERLKFMVILDSRGGAKIGDEYYARSTGWTTKEERLAVQRRLDALVHRSIQDFEKTPPVPAEPKPKQHKRNYHMIRQVVVSRVWFPEKITLDEAVKTVTGDCGLLALSGAAYTNWNVDKVVSSVYEPAEK